MDYFKEFKYNFDPNKPIKILKNISMSIIIAETIYVHITLCTSYKVIYGSNIYILI